MPTKILARRGSASGVAALDLSEIGLATDTAQFAVGDGTGTPLLIATQKTTTAIDYTAAPSVSAKILRVTTAGSVGAPTLTFPNGASVDTGFYGPSAGQVALAAAGVNVFTATNTALTTNLPLVINSTSHVRIAKGTTAQRPGTPVAGDLRLNTTLGVGGAGLIEFYDGAGAWNTLSVATVVPPYGLAGGTVDDITTTLANAPVAYVSGMEAIIKIVGSNLNAVTINCNGLGAKQVVLPSLQPLTAGMLTPGQMARFIYDATIDKFQYLNLSTSVGNGTVPTSVQSFVGGVAGMSLANKDLAVYYPDGKLYKGRVMDYICATANASIYSANYYNTRSNLGPSYTLQGDDGSVFTFYPGTGATVSIITKTTAAGTTTASGWNFSSGADSGSSMIAVNPYMTPTAAKFVKLTTGELLVVLFNSSQIKWMIVDQNLRPLPGGGGYFSIAGVTTVNWSAYNNVDVIALNNGNFAVSFVDASATLQLVVLSKLGSVVRALSSAMTLTGSPNPCFVRMVSLSDGNFALVLNSNFSTTHGLYAGVFSNVGAQVSALSLIYNNVATPTMAPDVLAVPGYFHIFGPEQNGVWARPNNNGAAVKWGGLSYNANGVGNNCKLLTDNTSVFAVTMFSYGASAKINIARSNLSGSETGDINFLRTANDVVTATGMSAVLIGDDIFVGTIGGTTLYTTVFNISNKSYSDISGFPALATYTTNGNMLAMDYMGDGVIAYNYDTVSPVGHNLLIYKASKTPIAGVVYGASNLGAEVAVNCGPGQLSVNFLGGIDKDFDFSADYGPKGRMLSNAVIIKGLYNATP